MGVRILEGTYDGSQQKACLVCSTSDTVFGPLFDDGGEAERFVAWLPEDARAYTEVELVDAQHTFRQKEAAES